MSKNDDNYVTSYPQATKENRALVAGLEARLKTQAQEIAGLRSQKAQLVGDIAEADRTSSKHSDRVGELEKTCDSLYYSLRMSEDHGVEEDLFEEDERGTGPDGLYPELEARWQEKTPEYCVVGSSAIEY